MPGEDRRWQDAVMRAYARQRFVEDEAEECAVAARRRKFLRFRHGRGRRHVVGAVFPVRYADDEQGRNRSPTREEVYVRDGSGELRLVVGVEEDEHRIS